jgi:hypothetical protein
MQQAECPHQPPNNGWVWNIDGMIIGRGNRKAPMKTFPSEFFFYKFSDEAFISIAWDNGMTGEWLIGKDFEGSGSDLIEVQVKVLVCLATGP